MASRTCQQRAQPCLRGLRQSQDNTDKGLGHGPHPVQIDQREV